MGTTMPGKTAREVLDMIRSKQDPLYIWRQQFEDEQQWQAWVQSEQGTMEILQDPRKGENWWPEKNHQDNALQDLIARLRKKHQ